MLYISRKVGESIIINGEIEIIVSELQKGRVKVGIQSPPHYVIWRKEIFDAVKNQNEQRQETDPPCEPCCAQDPKKEEKG
jgi:carbon storage regulator